MSSGVTKPPGGTGTAGATGAGVGSAVLGGAVSAVTGDIEVLGGVGCALVVGSDGVGDAAAGAVLPTDIGAA